MNRWFIIAVLVLWPVCAFAQPCEGGDQCVGKDDLSSFLQLARDHKCRAESAPIVTADRITIVTDRMGRIYGSGTGDKPFTLHMQWCNYDIEAKSQLKVVAAERVEPDWGFRLRLKAMIGLLVTEPFRSGNKFQDGVDAGLLIEPFYYHWANLNVFLGVRSVGLGVGFDLTKNVTLYVGYGLTWGSWRSSPYVGLGFSLW